MKFRSRLFLAFAVVATVPLVGFVLGLRNEMVNRLSAEYEKRAASLVSVVEADIQRESDAIEERLRALREVAVEDNRLRLAALQGTANSRRYLLDYAGNAMKLAGLTMLQIQDESGTIVSSGHFRNEFDRSDEGLVHAIASAPGGAVLVSARTATGPFLALVRMVEVSYGNRTYQFVGGVSVEENLLPLLPPDDDFAVSLVYPGGAITSGSVDGTPDSVILAGGDVVDDRRIRHVIRQIALPYVLPGTGDVTSARLIVVQVRRDLDALLTSVNAWFLIAVVAMTMIALLCAGWLSGRISKPLAELAGKTERIDLNRLDVDFSSERTDELGSLSRLMGAMTRRLRSSAAKLRDAERRATVGDLARQVNHDIKNGLTPIRNVLRHLDQVAQEDPRTLNAVFEERRTTLDASIDYLDTLARNYASLSPRLDRERCDVNALIREIVRGAASTHGVEVRLDADERVPDVLADAVVLRRVVENIVGNAVESLGSSGGTVAISTNATNGIGGAAVRIVVADTGPGMSEDQLDKAFDDFYSTKASGTGLGLSIVRRLVLDLNGAVRVETEQGVGTRVIVDLPSHATGTVPRESS